MWKRLFEIDNDGLARFKLWSFYAGDSSLITLDSEKMIIKSVAIWSTVSGGLWSTAVAAIAALSVTPISVNCPGEK